jgi:hypothetical protein
MLGGIALFLSLCAGVIPLAYAQEAGAPITGKYYTVTPLTLSGGTLIDEVIINGPPVPPPGFEVQRQAVSLPKPGIFAGTKTLTVPAFNWVMGCSAVSGAMIAGYYDQTGFPNIYTGPTNGGVTPMNNSSWPTWSDGYATYPSCPLIATRNGVDGRGTRGSIDDYWVQYNSTAADPYITNGWTQHAWGDAIGDYMKTSQSAFGNTDGSTTFYNWDSSASPLTCADMVTYGIQTLDGTYGRKLFYEARGYTVTDCYNQKTDNTIAGGFSFAQFKAEIDAGRPVMLNLAGHTVVGVGYDDSSSLVYIHDTWDYSNHTMTWGGSYSGMGLLSVSIVNLQLPQDATAPTPGAVTPSNSTSGSFVDSPFDLTTTFTDNESPVTSCEYTTDGSTWNTASVSGSSPTWTCTKTGITGTNGQSLTLNMRAASTGGTGTATQIAKTVDAAAPATADNLTSDSWQSTEKAITLTPNDGAGSGVTASTGIYGCFGAGCAPAALGGNTMTTACGAGNECAYNVRYYSRDKVGNTETTKTSAYQAKVDRKAPTDGAALIATSGYARCSLSWSSASDAGSGLNATDPYKLVYLTGATPPNTNCTNGTDITAVTTGTAYTHTGLAVATQYSYRECAYDALNNISAGKTATCTAGNTVLRVWGTSGETWYSLLQSAYNEAASGDDILALDSDFHEDLNFNRNVSLALQGGYGPDFYNVTGSTVLNGKLTISDGTVIIENLIIK